jgi:hypothetical protein
MHQPGDALAGDPNPVVIAFRQNFRPCPHTAGSMTHDGRGVVILRFDGSTPFLETAETAGHDSVWVDDDYDQSLGETQKIRPAHKDDDVLSQ